jgi:hypothetical protein
MKLDELHNTRVRGPYILRFIYLVEYRAVQSHENVATFLEHVSFIFRALE